MMQLGNKKHCRSKHNKSWAQIALHIITWSIWRKCFQRQRYPNLRSAPLTEKAIVQYHKNLQNQKNNFLQSYWISKINTLKSSCSSMKEKMITLGLDSLMIGCSNYGNVYRQASLSIWWKWRSRWEPQSRLYLTRPLTTEEEQTGTKICMTSKFSIELHAKGTDAYTMLSNRLQQWQIVISTSKSISGATIQSRACPHSSYRVCPIQMRCQNSLNVSEVIL